MAAGPAGDVRLIVEIKAKTGTTRAWAQALRKNLVAAMPQIEASYLLVALPDKIYLWPPQSNATDQAPVEVSGVEELFSPYHRQSEAISRPIRGAALELIVQAWVQDLLHRTEQNDSLSPHEAWISESGLLDALKDTHLVLDKAA
jgi:hypothetical protein